MTSSIWLREHPPIPGYEPIRVLGRNGAIVYFARSLRLNEPAVVQVWHRRALPSNAATMVGLDHPSIVRVLDVGEVDGHAYVAFEHVEAETLAHRLESGPLSNIDSRKCATAIASALQFARDAGVVVADLTPGVVFLTEPPKLSLYPSRAIDTDLTFAPPEATPTALTEWTGAADGYRVGALLYAMLTTQPPISMEMALRRRRGVFADYSPDPPRQLNPTVSVELETICLRCLEAAPLVRYASVRELAEALAHSS